MRVLILGKTSHFWEFTGAAKGLFTEFSEACPMTEPIVDWAQLADLKSAVGEDDFADIADVFLDEAAEALGRLDASDPAALAEGLHFLKGSALNLGFTAFARLCAEGEVAARAGQPVDPGPLVEAFDTARALLLQDQGPPG